MGALRNPSAPIPHDSLHYSCFYFNRDKRDTGESIEEEEKGVEVNIGNCVTEEEEDGTVTVLKLSNGVMFRVPVEVQGMPSSIGAT
jgi:hypothetical protein